MCGEALFNATLGSIILEGSKEVRSKIHIDCIYTMPTDDQSKPNKINAYAKKNVLP